MLPDYFFPTSVIGSLPRPQWLIDLVDEHDDDAICEREYQNTLDSAVLFAIALQERAGIDVITDGEWRRRTYFMAFAEFVTGFQKDAIEVSLLNGRKTTWPAVVSKLGYARSIAGHEARFVKANTKRSVKVTLPSPYMISRWFYDPDLSAGAYDSREALMQDAADILRREVVTLGDLGVDIVQFDDAMIGRFVGTEYNPTGTNPKVPITMKDRERELEMATWGMNRAVRGVRGVTTALHVCRGHRGRVHVAQGGFEPIAPYLFRVDVDLLALELAADDTGSLDFLKAFPEDKTLGMGAIDVLSRTVDGPEVVATRVKEVFRFLDKSRLMLNPDCGFAPAHNNPVSMDEAYLKLKSISAAAKRLREETL